MPRTDGYAVPPPGYEWVNGSLMSLEEMTACGWRIISRYPVPHPHSKRCLLSGVRIVTVWGMSHEKVRVWEKAQAVKRQAEKEERMKRRDSHQRSLAEDEHFRELYPELTVVDGGAA